jgi:hypothetical protein
MDDGRFKMATRRLSDALAEERAIQERKERRNARNKFNVRIGAIAGAIILGCFLFSLTPWAQALHDDQQRVIEIEPAAMSALPGAELTHRKVENIPLRPVWVQEDYIQEVPCSEVQQHYQQAAKDAGWKVSREPSSGDSELSFNTEYTKHAQNYQLILFVDCTFLDDQYADYGVAATTTSPI